MGLKSCIIFDSAVLKGFKCNKIKDLDCYSSSCHRQQLAAAAVPSGTTDVDMTAMAS